mgnify:CR=1 FL=1
MRNPEGDILRQVREVREYARLEEIRSSPERFAEYVMVDEKGKQWQLAEHHREWYRILWHQLCDIVEPGKHVRPPDSKDNLLILAPREHGKSSTMVCFLLYILGKNPNLRLKYVSGSADLAEAIVGQVAKNILSNPRLHEVFPDLKPAKDGKWNLSAIDVQKEHGIGIKDASLQAYGITAPATGGRADAILFDDCIRAREAIQEPARLETISQLFYQDWLNIGGYRHIVIGTPWTPTDIHAQLSQNDDWTKWKKPAIIEGKPLWPERWPIDKLLARKRQIGEVAFDLQFMLTGIREKMSWWTSDIVEKCKDPYTEFGKLPEGFEIEGIVVGFDPAASMKMSGSWSCIFALAYDKFRRKLPLRIVRKRGQPRLLAEALVDILIEIHDALTVMGPNGKVLAERRVDLVTVENNATQQAFIDLINLVCENRGINLQVPIVGAFTGTQKWNPELGLPRMVGEFENSRWIIPWGGEKHQPPIDPLHECNICSWIEEMLGYPYDTETTDMIMSSWLASGSIDRQVIGDLPAVMQRRTVNVTNVQW